MPEAPRRTTQDTWIPNGQDAPAPGPASADPGHEAATLDHKTEAGRRTEPSPTRGGADSTAGFGETDAARGSGTGTAGTESPLVAAHPQTTDRTTAVTSGTPGTTDRPSVPGPDGTGTHTPSPDGTGTHTPSPDGTGTHTPRPDGTGTRAPRPEGTRAGTGDHAGHHGPDSRLLADDTCDRLSAQLRQAVAGFVDRPRDAVEEADLVLHEITERLTDALTERRRTLTQHWKTPASGDPEKGDAATAADTEQLRLALRDYRELAERLLHV
ncbi:hypothetical protein [Streptomyces sp. McG7]|uniref:hypothetical protein n=1 Tax=Streptomyces sp. McG7 TaxID=2725486 RepID=UPI001BEC54FB|nr:hypothetical protein [Streptomyces sp. McG7]